MAVYLSNGFSTAMKKKIDAASQDTEEEPNGWSFYHVVPTVGFLFLTSVQSSDYIADKRSTYQRRKGQNNAPLVQALKVFGWQLTSLSFSFSCQPNSPKIGRDDQTSEVEMEKKLVVSQPISYRSFTAGQDSFYFSIFNLAGSSKN